ncbi:MAG: ATP-dependent ligase [Rhizobacter sp.]|nr:ATP-dependent ligase [Rhizobacter sp.]
MKRFAALFAELDATTATTAKVAALKDYFAQAAPADAAWAVYFLAGGKPRQVVPTSVLRVLACAVAGIDDWLFDESYQAVGDLAETIALVLPPPSNESDLGLAVWVEERLLPLRKLPPEEQAERIRGYWNELDTASRFILVKLIGGSFRVGVSKLLVQRALAANGGIDAKVIAQRMMGYTDGNTPPTALRYLQIVSQEPGAFIEGGQPYPFFLAHPLELPVEEFDARIGPASDWLVEWKYDGIRSQLVKRAGQVWVWSRGEELITERFPEIVAIGATLPDGCVLDGEIVVWLDDAPAPFALLQQRIGRKTLTKKVLADAPVTFLGYDILEWEGVDVRGRPQRERRILLEAAQAMVERAPSADRQRSVFEAEDATVDGVARVDGLADAVEADVPEAAAVESAVQSKPARKTRSRAATLEEASPAVEVPTPTLRLSPLQHRDTWAELAVLREEARQRGVEGFMLKNADAAYGVGRTKADGTWWKWKIEPHAVDAVLIYAQRGHGRRASVYTDYTFAVWSRTPEDAAEAQAVLDAIERREPAVDGALQLVPFAKAYSGLTDQEFARIDNVIRKTTLEKFGPVRSVKPSLVFELGFEGINRSARHKSGIAVRFPRMLRIRDDKPIHEADTLATLELLLAGPERTAPHVAD